MSETENTKAVILTQADGQKIFLDLNVSTDTTAIKSFEKGAELSIASFDYATGIAVFLALCATGLAYWYGQRSFKLTEMSFDTLIKQIESAEKLMLKSNLELIETQTSQQISSQKHEVLKENYNMFKSLAIQFIAESETFVVHMTFIITKHGAFEFSKVTHYGSYEYELHNEIENRIKKLYELNAMLGFYTMYLFEHRYELLAKNLANVITVAVDLKNTLVEEDSIRQEKLIIYKDSINKVKQNVKDVLKQDWIF